jgi:hypothetical protein
MRNDIKPKGIFISYDERRNGDICEAVTISNTCGYLIWFYPCALDVTRLPDSAGVIIKIKTEDRYYEGILDRVERLTSDKRLEELKRDTIHRPSNWWNQPDSAYKKFKNVLFIRNLARCWNPRQIRHLEPTPCHQFYK